MSSGNRSEDEIFEAALQHATREKRAAYLNEACGDDARLRERVEALLKAHDQAGEFLEQTPAGVSAKTFVVTTGMVPVTECPGDRIGRYKLRENLGEGRSEEHTSELQSPCNLVCRLLLEKKKNDKTVYSH